MCTLLGRAIVLPDTQAKAEKEEEQLTHYMDFDPYVIRERNNQMHREVNSLRLEEQVRQERGSSGSRFVAFAKRGLRTLLYEVQRAG
jgi:hypothetical protein